MKNKEKDDDEIMCPKTMSKGFTITRAQCRARQRLLRTVRGYNQCTKRCPEYNMLYLFSPLEKERRKRNEKTDEQPIRRAGV